MSVSAVRQPPFQLPAVPEGSDLVSKYFRTLADPTRLRILQLLALEGELSVRELEDRFGVAIAGISNHLACPRWCGFVATRREHRRVFNFIADERVLTLLELGDAPLADNAEQVAACCQTKELLNEPLVEVLTFDGCPHAGPALELVARVLDEIGIVADVRRVDVTDAESAEGRRFLGSPTIRVSCRLYRTQRGMRGEPDERWLREALEARA